MKIEKNFIKKNRNIAFLEENPEISKYYPEEYFFSKFLKFGKIDFYDFKSTFLKIYYHKYVNSYMLNRNDERQKYKNATRRLIKDKLVSFLV